MQRCLAFAAHCARRRYAGLDEMVEAPIFIVFPLTPADRQLKANAVHAKRQEARGTKPGRAADPVDVAGERRLL